MLQNSNNNFYLIRLIAAILVIISHSFALSGKYYENYDPFYLVAKITGYQNLGYQAVKIFFIISGFCVTASFLNTKSWMAFCIKRLFRIIPAYFTCLIVTTILLGLIFQSSNLSDYLTNPLTFQYLKDNILNIFFSYKNNYYLPGIFPTNQFKAVVNGSLWSIPYEMLMYYLIFILGVFKILKYKKIFLIFWLSLIISWYFQNSAVIASFKLNAILFELSIYFFTGALFYLWRIQIPWNKKYALMALTIIILSLKTKYYLQISPFFISYLTIYLAQLPCLVNEEKLNSHGDLSYGMYLYAFPIQQTFSALAENAVNPFLLCIAGINLTLFFAFFSWKFIEEPFQTLSKKFTNYRLLKR